MFSYICFVVSAMSTHEQNFDALFRAIKCCLTENKGIRAAAREYGVQKSTLQRHVQKVKANFDDISSVSDDTLLEFIHTSNMKIPPNMVWLSFFYSVLFLMNNFPPFSYQVFSVAHEKDLVEYIIKCMNHYYGLSINELRELAYQMANKLKLNYPSTWNDDSKAGYKWYYKFMKRHPELTLRTPEQTSINRVKAFCKQNVDKFFENLGRLMDEFHFESQAFKNKDITIFG